MMTSANASRSVKPGASLDFVGGPIAYSSRWPGLCFPVNDWKISAIIRP